MLQLLERWFGVPRFVARGAFAAALWHIVFVAAVTIVKSGTNALFLARADPSRLPLLYVAVAITVAIVTSGLARVLAKSPPARVLVIGVVGSAAAILISTVCAALRLPGALAAVYVVGEAAATSGSVLFWARVMDAFQPRDQKKVVGIVGAGGMLGAAIGGLLIRLIADRTGVVAPMIVSAVAIVAALPLLRALRTRQTRRREDNDARLLPALRYLAGRGYPLSVAGLVVLLAATGAATDFVFRTAAAEARTETEMAALFGMLNAVVGIVVVVFQVSLTPRLLARLGVFAFVALVPVLIVGTAVAHVLLPASFAVLVVMKGVEMAGAYSLNSTAVALLYNPMPQDLRSQVRTLIDGAVKKAGAALAGIGLAALAAWVPALMGSWIVALSAGATLALLPFLRARYLDALDDKLGQKKAPLRAFSIDPGDKVTRDALRNALASTNPEQVLGALRALGPEYTLASSEVSMLVDHVDERVRTAALAHVPPGADAALTERLLRIARTQGPRRPRAEAVRALARVHGKDAAVLVHEFLDADEPGVVMAAVEAALAHGEDARARTRLNEVVANLASRALPWRREVARLLGELDEVRYDAVLASLIEDADPTVRSLAVDAAGRERHLTHLVQLISHLGDRNVRPLAMKSLAQYGDDGVPALRDALDDVALPITVRIHLPRVLQSIGSDAAAQALLFSNPKDDAYLQGRIAAAVAHIVERNPAVTLDRKRIDDAIGRRLVAYQAYDDARADLLALTAPETALLSRIVVDRCHGNLRIALDLLGIHHGAQRMQTIHAGLVAGKEGLRHDALELLDASLQGNPVREEVLGLLEQRRPVRRVEDARARVMTLARSRDPLLRGVARRVCQLLRIDTTEESLLMKGPGAFELEGVDMSESIIERLFLLEHVDLFEGLTTDDLGAIAAIATEHALPAGALLYEEGQTGTSMYVIVEGDVELTRAGRAVMRLRAGESAGQVSFLDRGPRPVTGRVSDRGAARFLVIERDAFMDLLADRPGLMHAFLGVLAARLRALIEGESRAAGVERGRVTTAV